MSIYGYLRGGNRPIGDIALIVDCEKGDLDCGEEPSKNNELRKTKT